MTKPVQCGWCAEIISSDETRCPYCAGEVENGIARKSQTPHARSSATAASSASTPPRPMPSAGWYPHPNMAGTRRYWDGAKWTEHIAPDDHQITEHPKDDPAFAWALAVSPLAWVSLDLTVPKVAWSPYTWGALIVLMVLLGWLDSFRLKARGLKTGSMAGVGVPIYLWQRMSLAGSSAFIPIVWWVSAAAAAVTYYVGPQLWDFDSTAVASDIGHQIEEQVGDPTATISVTCPAMERLAKNDVITCKATDSADNSATVTVVITKKGGYTWQLDTSSIG